MNTYRFHSLLLGIIMISIFSQCTNRVYIPNQLNVNMRGNLMFVTLSINDKKGVFLVDTGANISLIDFNQARGYKFQYFKDESHGTIRGIGGNDKILVTSHINVKYGGIPYNGFRFYASDFSGLNTYFEKNGMKILGILGSDFLTKSKATINYSARTITLNSYK